MRGGDIVATPDGALTLEEYVQRIDCGNASLSIQDWFDTDAVVREALEIIGPHETYRRTWRTRLNDWCERITGAWLVLRGKAYAER